jgi:hypothetical protein
MDMEEFSSIQNKEINNENIDASQGSAILPQMKSVLQKLLRRVIIFIVYGPGVLGFLWLIGRILRR